MNDLDSRPEVERPRKREGEYGKCTSHELHIFKDGDWNVWLNTGVSDYDGICIGCGETRESAVSDAVVSLESAIQYLKGHP